MVIRGHVVTEDGGRVIEPDASREVGAYLVSND